MKKFNIVMLLSLFLVFTACENDEDRIYINSTNQVEAPVLNIDGITDIMVNEENIDLVPAVLNWTKSDFGQDVLVEYSLQIDDSRDFSAPLTVAVGNNVYTKSLTSRELSDWTINNFEGLDENGEGVKRDLHLRIRTTLSLAISDVIIAPDTLYSNAIEMSVLPYFVPAAFPSEMFMIGVDFGDWNWDSENIATMNPVHSHEGCFWAIRYITAGNGFKWNSAKAWNGSDFFSLGEDLGFTTSDGNAFVAEDGLYMVFIDMVNNRISVETAKVYGMGDCFGNWEVGQHPFTIEGRTMTITTANSGEVRMYAASDIAPNGNDWWQMEFVPMDGVIVYRGTGNDQDRITVDAGKKVVLDFNAETGIFE